VIQATRVLSEATPTLLTIAAVIGRQFDLALRKVSARSTATRSSGDRGSRSRQVDYVERVDAGALRLHARAHSEHPAQRSIAPGQRLEARVAKTMETLHQTSLKAHAAAIAHHLFEAGLQRTKNHSISHPRERSGCRGWCPVERADQLESAFSPVQDNDSPARRTLCGRRPARRGLGQLTGAIRDWETALQLCDAEADQGTVTALCQELAHSYAWTGQPLLGVAAAQRGLDSVGPTASSDRCRLLGARAWNLSMACDFENAAPLMREALVMAEQLGDAPLQGESLLLSSWHHYLCMQRREQADACRRAEELLRPTRDLAKLAEALVNLQMALLQIGRHGDIARTEDEVRTLSERLGRFDIKVHRLYSEALRSWLTVGNLGELDAGLQRVHDVAGAWAGSRSCQAQALLWRGHLGRLAIDRGKRSRTAGDQHPHRPRLAWSSSATRWLDGATGATLLDQRRAGLPRSAGSAPSVVVCTLQVIEGLALLGEMRPTATSSSKRSRRRRS
jgi:hypothetical protein